MKRVFVYGTLRKGLAWHHLIKGSNFLGEATTKEKYSLYADGIPYVLENQKNIHITGEIYEVDEQTLNTLDQLEGHPNWYCRKEIIANLNNQEITSLIYFFPKKQGELVESGNYLDYKYLKR